jgi:hypothetical protein
MNKLLFAIVGLSLMTAGCSDTDDADTSQTDQSIVEKTLTTGKEAAARAGNAISDAYETSKEATKETAAGAYDATKEAATGAYDATKTKVHETARAIADATAETSADAAAKAEAAANEAAGLSAGAEAAATEAAGAGTGSADVATEPMDAAGTATGQ